MPTKFKGLGANYYGWCIPVSPVWVQSKGKSGKWLHHIVVFRMELFLLLVVEAESKLESPEIRRLRSPVLRMAPAVLGLKYGMSDR